MTKSRTISNYWLTSVLPENALLINRRDAERLGLREGDKVRVRSASNPDGMWDLGNDRRLPLELKVKVVEGIRPGTVTFALGFGHWAYGASEIVIDGQRIPADPRRAKGVHLNAGSLLAREHKARQAHPVCPAWPTSHLWTTGQPTGGCSGDAPLRATLPAHAGRGDGRAHPAYATRPLGGTGA
jgi:hypothetical protein